MAELDQNVKVNLNHQRGEKGVCEYHHALEKYLQRHVISHCTFQSVWEFISVRSRARLYDWCSLKVVVSIGLERKIAVLLRSTDGIHFCSLSTSESSATLISQSSEITVMI